MLSRISEMLSSYVPTLRTGMFACFIKLKWPIKNIPEDYAESAQLFKKHIEGGKLLERLTQLI